MNRINTIDLPKAEKSGRDPLLSPFISLLYYYTEQWLSIRKAKFYSISIIKQLCDLG